MPANVIPTMRYRDADAAIRFLRDAFGFEEHMVARNDDGLIEHAQLTLGEGMIMLGNERDDEFGRMLATPIGAGGVTQSCYIVVPDVAGHYERARAAGAEIVMELRQESYGGGFYGARDPEGHLWSFGDYDPWTA